MSGARPRKILGGVVHHHRIITPNSDCSIIGKIQKVDPFHVGYQTTTSVAGFNFVTPTFDAVDGSGNVSLQDIKISGENVTDSVDNLQILDEGGATVSTYYYMTAATSGLSADGWVDFDAWALADGTVPYGASVLLSSANANVDITFAGQVASEDSAITTVAGFNFTGNNSPVEINIQDIVISGENVTDSVDNIQILDEGGATTATYYYMTAATSGFAADGWVDFDAWALADITLQPGQGVLVSTANAGVSVVIPSAL